MTAKIGYISTRFHPEHGYFGGYLVINHLARPLEFHCTMPVRPSRAQSLLYGSTIHSFLCGEQIAKALHDKAKLKPDLLLLDCQSALSICNVSKVHAIAIADSQTLPQTSSMLEIPNGPPMDLHQLEFKSVGFLACNANCPVSEIEKQLEDNFDVLEPFERVIEAIGEAHPIAKAA